MNIIKNPKRTLLLIDQLVEIWEGSVRETHLFLSNEELKNIKKYVPQLLKSIPFLIVAADERNLPEAFMGVAENKLEMLFVKPEKRGQGLGRKLIEYGIKNYSLNELTVNEQNFLAKGFYEYMGFHVYKRTDTDEQGNPYPLLYMKLKMT